MSIVVLKPTSFTDRACDKMVDTWLFYAVSANRAVCLPRAAPQARTRQPMLRCHLRTSLPRPGFHTTSPRTHPCDASSSGAHALSFQRRFLLGSEPIRTHILFLGAFPLSWDQTWRRDAGEGREVHACVRSASDGICMWYKNFKMR